MTARSRRRRTPSRWTSREGRFSIRLPKGSRIDVFEDSENFYAVSVECGEWKGLIQRFRSAPRMLKDAETFESILDGVLLGLEDAMRPMKVLERRVEGALPAPMRADLVLRGRQSGVDVLQRRRLIAPGPIPPAAMFLLTASCAAERFLVHRRAFEELFDGFRLARPGR